MAMRHYWRTEGEKARAFWVLLCPDGQPSQEMLCTRVRAHVIPVTDCIVCYGQAWPGMIQRSIASIVLAMLCWLSVPVAFGSRQMPSAQRFGRDTANDHACCPSSHPRVSAILFLGINSTAMPCGEQHPCYVRQAPSNPSTMPVETKVMRPASGRVLVRITDTPSSGGGRNVENAAVNFLLPPFERSTVLRI